MTRFTSTILAAGAIAAAALSFASPVSAVQILTDSTFDDKVINDGKAALIKFYAPWCGHCKKLAPVWDKLGEKYDEASSVVVGKVDCTVEKAVCERFGVRGYPTLKYFSEQTGADGAAYELGRDFESLDSFIRDNLEQKCSVSAPDGCTDKEKGYIAKMSDKAADDVAAQITRLEGMKAGSMKPELRKWLLQRIAILKQL